MKLPACVVALCLVGIGCQNTESGGIGGLGGTPGAAATGHERGSCRPDRTPGTACDPGLVCLSDLCVRPPAADCQAVADQLATLELGNYAEPEARAPVAARYRAACETALVSKEEAQCIDHAKTTWSARPCAPRMFPQPVTANRPDCAAAIAKTRGMMLQQTAYLNQPSMKAWFERTMAVMQEACEQDGWPAALVSCMLGASNTTGAMSQTCNPQMPPELQQKLQKRMTAALQQMPPPGGAQLAVPPQQQPIPQPPSP